jgi:chromosome partitioning protein
VITIAISNNKGGTGKTTSAVTLGTGLTLRGFKVALVDTDAQGHVALYLGLDAADDLHRLLIAELPLKDCSTTPPGYKNLLVIRSGQKTAVSKVVLGAQRAPVDVLAQALGPLQDAADYCIIDAAPSIDSLGLATLYAADYALIPSLCETLSLDGIRNISKTIQELRNNYRARTQFLGVLPTKYRRGTREHKENLHALVEAYGRLVFNPIPLATAVAESTAYREPLWTYAPDNQATLAYGKVLERIINDAR